MLCNFPSSCSYILSRAGEPSTAPPSECRRWEQRGQVSTSDMYFGVTIHVDSYLCYVLSFSKNSDALLESESCQMARMHVVTILCSLLVQTGTPHFHGATVGCVLSGLFIPGGCLWTQMLENVLSAWSSLSSTDQVLSCSEGVQRCTVYTRSTYCIIQGSHAV